MIPPLPLVRIESSGVVSLNKPNILEMSINIGAIDMAPIIPPKASVPPNSLAALIPV